MPPDFFATGAQVIPTLLLTYVVERRFTERDAEQPPLPGLLWVAACIGLMVVGEMVALAGLAGSGGTWSARVVVLACGVALFLVVSPFVFGYMSDAFEDENERPISRPTLTAVVGGLGALVSVVVAFSPIVAAVVVAVVAF